MMIIFHIHNVTKTVNHINSEQSSLLEIHFTYFIDENKNEFISNTSNIRTISPNADKLLRDGCIYIERYEDIMVNSFFQVVSKFITKWGINMVPINICIAVDDVEKYNKYVN